MNAPAIQPNLSPHLCSLFTMTCTSVELGHSYKIRLGKSLNGEPRVHGGMGNPMSNIACRATHHDIE